ncbi:sensor histidine kinase [Aureimonas leprariae]|uniref:histidine kinase n=1 Tax=Plantimonas leprariae TaxID=2615207 RepID=A0A7V7TZ06_9HYPH|nr:HAMP domain-containing sensor histidine kinase [Aureimonas leprariae]KAB0678503.1 HAMP domain-containing histidine kinase [Aureimonas leprariae]
MRLVPLSLGGRLLAAAALFVLLAVAVAGIVIAGILGHFVRLQLDSRLDAQIEVVAASLRLDPAGRLVTLPRADGPPFDRPDRGWYWQAFAEGGTTIASPSLRSERLRFPADPPDRFLLDYLRPWPAELEGPRREPLVARIANRIVDGRPVRIVATAPRAAFVGPLLDALLPVMAAMAALGVVLFGMLVLQVRLGLRPLGRLRADVEAIRRGEAARLAERQPAEVAPLAAEINALLDKNEAGLERARRHVANLAHGLKTPLATVSVLLQESDRDPNGEIASLVGSMDRLIRHHLARARTAALGGPERRRLDLVPRLDDLALVVGRIHADRRIAFERRGPRELFVACEAEDCDELFGNLLDNAFRHAASRVRMELAVRDGEAWIAVEDDGPGLPDERVAEALRPGRRLDEGMPGFGFGLPIAGEIAELYGGGISLGRSDIGGLAVNVALPIAPAA